MDTTTAHITPATDRPKAALLSDSQLLAGLTDSELREVDRLTAMTRCERGKVFFSPEDEPGTVWFLKAGRVRLYRRTGDGKQLTVAMLDPGAVFGENALIGQTHAGVYAEAAEDGLLCVMPASSLRELVQRFPRIGLNLLVQVGQRLKRSQELAEEVAYWSVKRRLARLLLELDERYGHPTLGGGRVINKAITQAEIAELIGSTPETVAEQVISMKKLAVHASRGRRLVICDRAELERCVERRDAVAA
jgi:CRP/FNR family transcriptional regulator